MVERQTECTFKPTREQVYANDVEYYAFFYLVPDRLALHEVPGVSPLDLLFKIFRGIDLGTL